MAIGDRIGGPVGAEVVRITKAAFIHAMGRGMEVGAVVALAGAAVAAVWLPSRAKARTEDFDEPGVPEAVPAEAPVVPGDDGGRGASDGAVSRLLLSETREEALNGVPAGAGTRASSVETDGPLLTPEPLYDAVEPWVDEWFAPTFGPRLGFDQWCPQWWEHAEAVVRLEALWRAWELLRLDPALGMATWLRDYLEPQWDVLIAATSPLQGCEPASHDFSPQLSMNRILSPSVRTEVP